MFIVTLSYQVPLDVIDASLQAHSHWLDTQYDDGVFLASGRQVPRTGGVIFADGISREELQRRLALDPFQANNLAVATVLEFTPGRVAPGLERLQG